MGDVVRPPQFAEPRGLVLYLDRSDTPVIVLAQCSACGLIATAPKGPYHSLRGPCPWCSATRWKTQSFPAETFGRVVLEFATLGPK